jgi:hypothetical protein
MKPTYSRYMAKVRICSKSPSRKFFSVYSPLSKTQQRHKYTISSYLRRNGNQALMGRMAAAGRTMVERRFTLQALCERHENFYGRVVEGWRRKKELV